ncbi:MAG: helix-turn-helix domain-containing protein [archaeon]
MVFWFFKKRDDSSEDINAKLHSSFSNIKKDMVGISEWISHFKTKHNNHDQNYEFLSKEINTLKEDVKYLKALIVSQYQNQQKIEQTKQEEPKINYNLEEEKIHLPKEKILQSLTLTQVELLKSLARIQYEHDLDSVSLRDIKEEYYPSKNYNEVRTTISQYLDILLELGLVTKKRKGRQIYTSLTEKGKQLFPNYQKELELKNKAKKKNGPST